ncbi:MAG: cobamide remodeling phosphodiesterase CbiR [Anaerolineae bacterium]|jgi:sugar phosphate isomerase/epimerase
MLNLGSTTLPLAGWVADPRHPSESCARRLAAIRQLVLTFGLSHVELTADLAIIFPQVFDRPFYALVADLQQDLGFGCSIHLPFLWIDPCSLNEPLRQTSVSTLRQILDAVGPVEVSTFVLHLWGFTATRIAVAIDEPSQPLEVIVDALLQQGRRSLEQLFEALEPDRVCVENLEDALFDRAMPLLSDMGARICFDVGHLACQGDDVLGFLAEHGDRIGEVHLHDALMEPAPGSSLGRDHLALGQGDVDYGSLLRSLQERGFDGPVVLEVNHRAALEQSVAALRHWR